MGNRERIWGLGRLYPALGLVPRVGFGDALRCGPAWMEAENGFCGLCVRNPIVLGAFKHLVLGDKVRLAHFCLVARRRGKASAS